MRRNDSKPINSSRIIGNTSPQVDSAGVLPSTTIYTTSPLVASYTSSDVDSDSIIDYYIIWKKGFTSDVSSLTNLTTVPFNYTLKMKFGPITLVFMMVKLGLAGLSLIGFKLRIPNHLLRMSL